jgi:gliding motility associated protien GldN
MKKIFLALSLFLVLGTGFGQNVSVLDGVYVKEHTLTRRIIPFPPLREADVFFSKRVWRVIDLKEKMNLPLRYPIGRIKDSKSFINVIMDAVVEGSLTAYKPNDDEFTFPMTKAEVDGIGGAGVDTQMVASPDPPYNLVPQVITKEFSREKVIAYRLKEDWFFDKQRSVMDVRIIGIAPLMYDEDDQGNIREGAQKKPLFWIYYPEARKIFANAEVFNRLNDAERRSFEDIFTKRVFSSYITKESNVYDRRIEDYKTGLDALLEAQKVKEDLINFEHDLWEY